MMAVLFGGQFDLDMYELDTDKPPYELAKVLPVEVKLADFVNKPPDELVEMPVIHAAYYRLTGVSGGMAHYEFYRED
jgi:hypothetical protein